MPILWTIALRELRGAFTRPVAPIAVGLFLVVLAAHTLWIDDVLLGGVTSLRGPFSAMAVGLSVLAPVLSMGTIAGERQRGTLQLLQTWPVHPTTLVAGKWLGTWLLLMLALALTLPWPLALAWLGPLDPGPVLTSYAGLALFGGALSAIGVACSAWTRRPVIALSLAITLTLAPWLWGNAAQMLSGRALSTAQWLSAPHHLDLWARGLLDSRSLVMAVALTLAALQSAVLGLHRSRLQ